MSASDRNEAEIETDTETGNDIDEDPGAKTETDTEIHYKTSYDRGIQYNDAVREDS